ncbi:MAG: hypothetical protein HDT26_09350 [Subdoligranulum sp.]|nr:hypothetical protein [Subdoligranulum sp.]
MIFIKPLEKNADFQRIIQYISVRRHRFTAEQFEQVMAFERDDAMQKKWKAFCRKIDTKTGDYDIVLRTINNFLTDPFTAAIEKQLFAKKWSAAANQWTEADAINA